MLFTAAAGNEGTNNNVVPSFPANYDLSNVISVASTTSRGELSGFSCYGSSTVHVAAPGSHIYSTVPKNEYEILSGTSMATPHVSGLAALVWMYRPQLSMHQVKEIITGSVRKLPDLEGKVITGGLINAKNALEAAWAFDPPHPPAHAPQAIAFEDADPRIGVYGGVVTITAAADESDIEYYRVYMVSGAGFQLEALGEPIPATGEAELILELNESFVPSTYARALVAVSGRASGEMPAQLRGLAPHVDLEDYGLPVLGPKLASWTGDEDARDGFIKGSLLVDRAADEASITAYHIYWQSASGTRGSMVGSIPAVGFLEPTCSGPSCGLFNVSRTADGAYIYDHRPYTDEENAVIAASGPGRLDVTFFQTEDYYDKLTVGDVELTGDLNGYVPYTLNLGEGRKSIQWTSDESIPAGGWTFHLRQEGAVAELKLEATAVMGSGFLVVPAYGKHELTSDAIFVEILDSTEALNSTADLGGKRRLSASASSQNGHHSEAGLQGLKEKLKRTSRQAGEPWLHQSGSASQEAERALWSASQAAPLSSFAARHGRVRSSATISGLAEDACAKPAARAALAQALAAQLPGVEESGVRLLRMSAVSTADGGAAATADHHPSAVKVEFEIEPAAGMHAVDLDRVESQLILLSTSKRASERFDAALAAALKASGVLRLSEDGSRGAIFGAPQQLSPKMLAAALPAVEAVERPGDRRLRGAAPPQFV